MIQKRVNHYASSIVLGLNDALVELTGALAGLTFALRDGKIIALSGLVLGIAASLSMAASSYLSSREEAYESSKKISLKKSVYTGIAYLITVLILVLPYFILTDVYSALVTTLVLAILIIVAYSGYVAKQRKISFWRKFFEMAVITASVSVISFLIGTVLRDTFL